MEDGSGVDPGDGGDPMKRIVILGGGTGGTLTANRVRRVFAVDEMSITVIDIDDRHVYQPGLLFLPFGLTHAEDIVRPRGRQLHKSVGYRTAAVERVDIDSNMVQLADGTEIRYDVLVVATGAELAPDETEGLTGTGWLEKVFTFYTPEGARAEGIEANLFFTFFGLDAIRRKRFEHIKVATVGNPGMDIATMLGALPGMSAIATHMLERKMESFDIPSIPEFVEMIADTGCGIYACKASVDLFRFTHADFVNQVQDIITVGEFYEIAADGEIIFT